MKRSTILRGGLLAAALLAGSLPASAQNVSAKGSVSNITATTLPPGSGQSTLTLFPVDVGFLLSPQRSISPAEHGLHIIEGDISKIAADLHLISEQTAAAAQDSTRDAETVKSTMTSLGAVFPPGSVIQFDPVSRNLTVQGSYQLISDTRSILNNVSILARNATTLPPSATRTTMAQQIGKIKSPGPPAGPGRSYKLDIALLAALANSTSPTMQNNDTLKAGLEKNGVKFSPRSVLLYSPNAGIMIVFAENMSELQDITDVITKLQSQRPLASPPNP